VIKITHTKKTTIFILLASMFILSVFYVNAMTASTLTALIQVNVNETPVVIQKSLGIRNDNNFSVDVSIEPAKEIIDIVKLEEYNISMEPNELRFVKFNLTINEPIEQRSSINIIFSKQNVTKATTQDKFGIASTIVIKNINKNMTKNNSIKINQTQVNQTTNTNKGIFAGYNKLLIAVIIILFILIISLIILKLTRWKK
jgi:hypothetical protein